MSGPAGITKVYLAMLLAFFAIDMLWLGVLARGFYREHLGDLLRPDVRWGAAVAFYLLFLAGLFLFVVQPALARDSFRHAVGLGAAFGVVTYAAYDLTNLATLRGFPGIVAAVDLAWGAVLCASVAAVGFAVGRLVT